MKDVAALCRRVVIIAQGQIMYDGSLAGIVDRFSGHKIITLQFADDDSCPNDWTRYGEVLDVQAAQGEAARSTARRSPRCWPRSSPTTRVEDVSVEDPPLEEVIAEMFSQATERTGRRRSAARSKPRRWPPSDSRDTWIHR